VDVKILSGADFDANLKEKDLTKTLATTFAIPLPRQPKQALTCAYWDATAKKYATTGVTANAADAAAFKTTDNVLYCSSTHLTLFAGYGAGTTPATNNTTNTTSNTTGNTTTPTFGYNNIGFSYTYLYAFVLLGLLAFMI